MFETSRQSIPSVMKYLHNMTLSTEHKYPDVPADLFCFAVV